MRLKLSSLEAHFKSFHMLLWGTYHIKGDWLMLWRRELYLECTKYHKECQKLIISLEVILDLDSLYSLYLFHTTICYDALTLKIKILGFMKSPMIVLILQYLSSFLSLQASSMCNHSLIDLDVNNRAKT